MLRRALIRGEALLLAVLVVATPLLLMARPSFGTHSKCNGMCCRAQRSHSATTLAGPRSSLDAKLSCPRGTAAHITMCMVPSGPQDRPGVLAPLPPAILAEQDAMDGPRLIDQDCRQDSQLARAGFAPIPFEPPRA